MLEPKSNTKVNPTLDIFEGGGLMGSMMRAYDWDTHPLGNPQSWSQSLKTSIRLVLHSRFPMFIWWSGEFYKFYNDAYLPALGKKHPVALGAKAPDVWSEIWDQVGGISQDIMENGDAFYTEDLLLYLERKGFSEETYWTFSYSPAFDDDGKVAGIFCACTEETSNVLSQRRLNTLKDSSDVISQIYSLDQACQVTCEILTKNEQDIPFSLIYLLDNNGTEARLAGVSGGIAAEDAPRVITDFSSEKAIVWPLSEAIRTRRHVVFDYPSTKLATEQPNQVSVLRSQAVIYPILRSDQEHVLGFFVAGINPHLEYTSDYINFHKLITGQIATSIISIQAREAVIKQQETLNEMFQQAPVGITILRGPEYVVELANPGVCEIWGRNQSDILGMPVLEALPEVKDQGIKELLDSVYYTGVPFVANELPVTFVRNGKQEEVYLNFVYQPVRDSQGTITGIIAVAIDINEQVAARREIEAMNRELLAINADLDNFVYSASHDLKAPISNIEGLMQALMDYLPQETLASEIVQDLTGLIDSSIERFKKALSDLTEVAKIQREAGDDVTSIKLADVVNEVLLDFESEIKSSGATVDNNIAEDALVHFSAKNVRSVVYNLVSNALKYRSPDRKPRISVFTRSEPDYIVFSVEDNGLGINMSDEKKIFSMFKRLHDHVEGSGIGLYIVKRIVENAGGRIQVESTLGEGATFSIFFRR